MDGNCNIITEILLVISYTTSYCKKSNIITVTKLLVTSYCPTLVANRKSSILVCNPKSSDSLVSFLFKRIGWMIR